MAVANVATWAGRSMILNQLANNALLSGVPKQIMWGYPYSGGAGPAIVNGSAITDVNLFQPGAEARVAGTVGLASANQLADTYVVTGTITATATRTVNEVGVFDSTSASPTGTTNSTAANATTTTVGLTGATGSTGLLSAGNYYAQWDNEVVLVTGGQNTNAITVTRGALGSTATAHQASGPITAGGDGGAHSANASIGGETANLAGANGGSILCHADFANIGLNLNDSIAFTLKVQLQ